MIAITRELVKKLVSVIDVGLCKLVGKPIEGQMCVEAAVCYSFGYRFGDQPECVDKDLRDLMIYLNDFNWCSKLSRAKGLRKLAILQLGTSNSEYFNRQELCDRFYEAAVRKVLPYVFQSKKVLLDSSESNKFAYFTEISRQCEFENIEDTLNFIRSNNLSPMFATALVDLISRIKDCTVGFGNIRDFINGVVFKYETFGGAWWEERLLFIINVISDILVDMNVPGVKYLDQL